MSAENLVSRRFWHLFKSRPIIAAHVTWEDVLYSIDNMLAEMENQDDNPNLGYHEAALLNRLEVELSVLCSLLDTDLDLNRILVKC